MGNMFRLLIDPTCFLEKEGGKADRPDGYALFGKGINKRTGYVWCNRFF